MKKIANIYLAFSVLIISVTVFLTSLYTYNLSKVSNDETLKEIVIEKGSITSVGNTLKEQKLIKSVLAFKIYVYISGKTNLKAATYDLSESMGTKKIVDILSSDIGNNTNEVKLTFNEGLNIREIAQIIDKNTNNSEEDVFNLLKDKEYLQELINKYWFLEDEILNDKIYYSLEGYLYPNTYSFSSVEVSIKEIFEVMLDDMDRKLTKYREELDQSSLSIHELITLASIVELEGSNIDDRKGIAGVFYNRINKGMTLGSDVTTYYGAKVNMSERELYASEISECNDYNTRCSTFNGLPISPICNPSIEAIEAVIQPTKSNYYYFVADINKKIYFSQSSTEHNQTIYNLKTNNLWYEY